MEPTIYIDVLFLVTWGMQAFLLWAAGRIAGSRAKGWRLLLGGLLSAICYCCHLLLFRKNGGILFSLLLLSIGTGGAYLPRSTKQMGRLLLSVCLASFLMGGGIQLLFGMTQLQRCFGQGLILQKGYPWWLLPWSVLLAYLLLKGGAKWMESHICRRREFCTVMVFWRGRRAEGRALIDTGNGLRQQDGRGVAILAMDALLPLFSPGERCLLLSGEGRALPLESLPFRSLGHPDGRLWGLRAEALCLSFGERQIWHRSIFLGISEEGFAGAYEGLVPPNLIEEE